MPIACCLFDPFLHMAKALSASDVIAYKSADRTPIIPFGDGFEALLPSLDK